MDEKGASAEVKGDLSGQMANNTPSKPRQNGHASAKKQPRAAKQLRFEGNTAASLCNAPAAVHRCPQVLEAIVWFLLVGNDHQHVTCPSSGHYVYCWKACAHHTNLTQ